MTEEKYVQKNMDRIYKYDNTELWVKHIDKGAEVPPGWSLCEGDPFWEELLRPIY